MIEKEKVINECLRRMKVLKLYNVDNNGPITDFKDNGEVWKSERDGILYWLNEEEKEAVEKFEKEHEGLKVYHCIYNNTEFGRCLTMLYVNGRNEEEFEEDTEYFNEDIKDGYIMAYVENLSDEWCSDFGSVGIKLVNGGVQRIG